MIIFFNKVPQKKLGLLLGVLCCSVFLIFYQNINTAKMLVCILLSGYQFLETFLNSLLTLQKVCVI